MNPAPDRRCRNIPAEQCIGLFRSRVRSDRISGAGGDGPGVQHLSRPDRDAIASDTHIRDRDRDPSRDLRSLVADRHPVPDAAGSQANRHAVARLCRGTSARLYLAWFVDAATYAGSPVGAHMSAMVHHVACQLFGHVWHFAVIDGALWGAC